jgi:hypothetical protein
MNLEWLQNSSDCARHPTAQCRAGDSREAVIVALGESRTQLNDEEVFDTLSPQGADR